MPNDVSRDLRSDVLTPGDEITDDELAALAMASDPDAALDDDAVSFWEVAETGPDQRLPEWYMPWGIPGGGRLLFGWRRQVVLTVIASFLAINAYGLCNTYGWVGFG